MMPCMASASEISQHEGGLRSSTLSCPSAPVVDTDICICCYQGKLGTCSRDVTSSLHQLFCSNAIGWKYFRHFTEGVSCVLHVRRLDTTRHATAFGYSGICRYKLSQGLVCLGALGLSPCFIAQTTFQRYKSASLLLASHV